MSNYPAGVTQSRISALCQDVEDVEDYGSFDCVVCHTLFRFTDFDQTEYEDHRLDTRRMEHYLKSPCCFHCYIRIADSHHEDCRCEICQEVYL